jgi:predicted permease
MSLLNSFLGKVRALFFRNKLDREMAEEMEAHLAMQEELNRASGMTAPDARLAAQRQFGHVSVLQEKAREERGVSWFFDFTRDVQFAFRSFGKTPGFAITVMFTLALAIATNTHIFALVNMCYLRPLQVSSPENLVLIAQRSTAVGLPHGVSFKDFQDYRERLTQVRDVIAYAPRPVNFGASGKQPERSWTEFVTPDAFTKLGVASSLGRTLLPSDGEAHGAQNVAVLSYAFWQNKLGGDRNIVGRSILVNGKPVTVVGVGPQGFDAFAFGLRMDLFMPSGTMAALFSDGAAVLENRGIPTWKILARLPAGVSLDTARAELQSVAEVIARDHPVQAKDSTILMVRESRARPDISIADLTPLILGLFAAMVALILFIACANVANLMLARAMTRQRELAVRSAMGATRGRLIRQMLVESTLLSLGGGALAYLLHDPMQQLMSRFTPQGEIPAVTDYTPDWRHFVFVPLLSLFAGVIAGLLPALRASRTDLLTTLKQGSGTCSPNQKHRLRNLLVTGQVAMSLVVLVCAGLFTRSLRSAQTVPLGFNPARLVSLAIDLDLQSYDATRGKNFQRELLTKVSALPEIESAALVQHVPFGYASSFAGVWPETPPPGMKDGSISIGMTRVSANYFEAMGVPVVRGRGFTSVDLPDSPRVAVVNQLMAELCWPGQDAIGKRFRMWNDQGPWAEVVGVVPTGKYQMIGESPRPFFYLSLDQVYDGGVTMMARARRDAAAVVPSLRAAIASMDPDLPVFSVRTLDEHLRASVFGLMPLRMGAVLATIQGAVGLFLSVLGLYAVVSYGVTQRTREIGVRMALGASRDTVTKLVVREGLRLTLIGIGVGGVFAIALGLGLSKLLFALPPFDGVVFVAVVAILIATTLFACWWPARRAASVDPMQALRTE